MRLRYGGYAHRWGTAIYVASKDSYEDQIWFSGSTEEIFDLVCDLAPHHRQHHLGRNSHDCPARRQVARGADGLAEHGISAISWPSTPGIVTAAFCTRAHSRNPRCVGLAASLMSPPGSSAGPSRPSQRAPHRSASQRKSAGRRPWASSGPTPAYASRTRRQSQDQSRPGRQQTFAAIRACRCCSGLRTACGDGRWPQGSADVQISVQRTRKAPTDD
jgi:hypothetical protein